MSTAVPLLEAIQVSRTYPGVQALEEVNLTLRAGEVTALMGENGAGKSTLIRIFGGLERPSAGRIQLRGAAVGFRNAADSQAAGISVVSQEFRLVPQLSVAENIFLGHEVTRSGLLRPRIMRRRAYELLRQLDLDINPAQVVETLSVGDQQLVEITRALASDFDVLIMDEPTAALNVGEVARLLSLVRTIRDQGKAILYVSHHLEEIFEIADRIAVFRDGRSVAEVVAAGTSEPELVALMLGRELQQFDAHHGVDDTRVTQGVAPPRFAVAEFTCPQVRTPVSFDLEPGEILGVAGLVGSGRTELIQALFGALPSTGSCRLDGTELRIRTPAEAIAAGLFMLSENRKQEGIFPHLSVLENLLIAQRDPEITGLAREVPSPRTERAAFDTMKQELNIRVDRPQQYIGNLSGGNQQKVLFGRAMLSGCSVLLLNEPTRGVDVGAKVEIYQLIRRLAESGVAIVISSSDTPELVTLVHRCAVMQGGQLKVILNRSEISEDAILAHSVGTGSQTGAA
ncbi:MAG: sugar ABC transporter ATP-binding protein [Propioniciclava sp.]